MKLFKKVMASVLAGVLALSMVACGTNVNPNPGQEIPTNPIASTEENVLAAVNFARTTKFFVDPEQVEVDKTSDALAETVAKILSAGPNDTECAYWTRNGQVYVPTKTIDSIMNRDYNVAAANYNVDNVYIVANNVIVKPKHETLPVTVIEGAADPEMNYVECLIFNTADVKNSVFGSYAKQQLANVGYKMGSAPTDIGIADVKTNGKAIILVSVEDLTEAPKGNLSHIIGGNTNNAD